MNQTPDEPTPTPAVFHAQGKLYAFPEAPDQNNQMVKLTSAEMAQFPWPCLHTWAIYPDPAAEEITFFLLPFPALSERIPMAWGIQWYRLPHDTKAIEFAKCGLTRAGERNSLVSRLPKELVHKITNMVLGCC